MAILGLSPIQLALLAEASMNIYGVVAMYMDPSSLLVLLLPATTPHTDAMKSQIGWVAALTLGITPAILLCVPDAPHQTVARRTLYTTFMGFEACMVLTAAAQFHQGNSGFTDSALLGTMAVFTFFTLLRVFFLYIKPSWIDSRSKAKAV